MNKIAVLTYMNGQQGLKTIKEIMSIGREYKQEWSRLKALAMWCYCSGVKTIQIYRMDGSFEATLITRNA